MIQMCWSVRIITEGVNRFVQSFPVDSTVPVRLVLSSQKTLVKVMYIHHNLAMKI